jgi:hypothetical protein
LSRLTLATNSHGHECARPGVHDALTQRDNVLEHLKRRVGYGNGGGLLQDLGDDREIRLKGRPNGLSNITKALKNGGLELVTERRALSKFVRKALKIRMIR